MKTLALLIAAWPLVAQNASVRPDRLRCEYRVNPLGIDVTEPRLSWTLVAVDPKARDLKQSAYRVLVASNEQNLAAGKGDLWDTGKVASSQSVHVVYAGRRLTSRARAFWKVLVWDQAGRSSVWSPAADWTMGLLEAGDWKGQWIGRDETGVLRDPDSPYQNLLGAHWIWAGSDFITL